MIDATMMPAAPRATRPVAMSLQPTPRELLEIWSRDLGRSKPFVDEPSQALVLSGASSDLSAHERDAAADCGADDRVGLRCVGVRLDLAGTLGRRLRADVRAPQSPGAGVSAANSRPLQPGDAIGVALLTGDFELGATGTVTHVDGDRVYAFGHPLYNLGPTQFPMTRADVQVVLPSLMSSSKLASFGEVVGTVQQDRATAIAGRSARRRR